MVPLYTVCALRVSGSIPMSESPPENAAPCGSSSELDFPGTSISATSPFGT